MAGGIRPQNGDSRMKTYETGAGENIFYTAKRMVALARRTNDTVKAKFNRITLTAKPGDSPDAIMQYYDRRHKARRTRST